MWSRTSGQPRSLSARLKKTNSSCSAHNHVYERKRRIQSFAVVHPFLDRLMQIKMAKCLQHGNVRNYDIFPLQTDPRQYKIEAPTISGSMKIMSFRPKTSTRPTDQIEYSRPKSTNTVIRSRTSQPRIQQKLEMISKKQPTQFEQQQLKPSLMLNRIKKSAVEVATLHRV